MIGKHKATEVLLQAKIYQYHTNLFLQATSYKIVCFVGIKTIPLGVTLVRRSKSNSNPPPPPPRHQITFNVFVTLSSIDVNEQQLIYEKPCIYIFIS